MSRWLPWQHATFNAAPNDAEYAYPHGPLRLEAEVGHDVGINRDRNPEESVSWGLYDERWATP